MDFRDVKYEDFDDCVEGNMAGLIKNKKREVFDEDEGVLSCVVMTALENDAHGDVYTIDCVKKSYEDYFSSSRGFVRKAQLKKEIQSKCLRVMKEVRQEKLLKLFN